MSHLGIRFKHLNVLIRRLVSGGERGVRLNDTQLSSDVHSNECEGTQADYIHKAVRTVRIAKKR